MTCGHVCDGRLDDTTMMEVEQMRMIDKQQLDAELTAILPYLPGWQLDPKYAPGIRGVPC